MGWLCRWEKWLGSGGLKATRPSTKVSVRLDMCVLVQSPVQGCKLPSVEKEFGI